ncbi:polyhydroxyalkanoic acid system family protein [Methylobacterium iners]|uniref:Polyhydroxyalkanoic acid synthase n=1 Tax=Methylobacterium iners TaxID=418707 RepID=A0ABQ4RTC9_9HYPH|nr:polyhydroxyalkanoic acid system family protein [Methylobacterium iners]GJD93625.1 hypothetical protein OCOJLMKI_0821 [Methylobacterium iners]
MAKRIVVHVPHRLGIEEARQRLNGRADWAQQKLRREGVRLVIADWKGNDRPFTAHALGQHVDGLVAVTERSLRFEIGVPWMLSVFSPKIEAAAKHYAARLMA